MNILFLSISSAVSNLKNRGIYPDLLRKFADEGHSIFIVCPAERRQKVKTNLRQDKNVSTLMVQTLNITKTNIIEKGIGTLLIEFQYKRAISKYFSKTKFDLILYATPPITFNGLIKKFKKKHQATTYLLLKDIFPQNAVDIGMLSKWNPIYTIFRCKEKKLYKVSDFIGCMSKANVSYLINNNPEIHYSKVEVCPNSIALSQHEDNDKGLIRQKYHIPGSSTVFIYGGNLGKPQGIDFLLEVLLSNKNRENIFFVIAGSGTEVNKIEKFLETEKPKNIILLPQMPRSDFDVLLNACDIGLIFLDHRYTIPNYPSRLLNYLEFGKPVLMATDPHTDVGKIAEENGYGLWAESTDIKSFNKRIEYLLSNKEITRTMGEKGYQYLLDNFTVDKTFEIIMSHL